MKQQLVRKGEDVDMDADVKSRLIKQEKVLGRGEGQNIEGALQHLLQRHF